MADNLELQGGVWHARLAVPKDVQKAFDGRRILSLSLKTGSRREAMTRRLPILHEWKSQIATARTGVPLPEGWQEKVATTVEKLEEYATLAKRERIGEKVPPFPEVDPAEVQRVMQENPGIVAALKQMVARRMVEPMGMIKFEDDLAGMVKQFVGLQLNEDHRLTPDQQSELTGLIGDPRTRKPRSPITAARLTAFREFRETQKGAPKHIDQQVGRMERLSTFLKEKSLPLDFDSVHAWILSLDKAPATLSQHLMSGSAFWSWAIKYDTGFRGEYKDKVNPFRGHDLPQGGGRETSGEQRETYSVAELEKLHKGALDAGNNALADLILLGAYTGSRIEQLCQLRVEHIVEEEGVTSFNFVKGKNKAARRIVPIHPAIKGVVERLKEASTDGFLIPTTTENLYGKRSHALSKAFGYLKKIQGFGPLHVFHSMRNTVITAMLRADVPDFIVMEIVGHATGKETHDTYSRGASAQQKFDAICKLPILEIGR